AYNDKQLQIMNTAEKLFSNKGFDGTSVRDIAEEAGVNLAMISYYFGSKEKLMQALFEERTSYIRLRVEDLLKNTHLTPLEKIYQLIDDYVDRVLDRQKFYKIMICEQMLGKNEGVIQLLNEIKLKNSELSGKLIKEGQEKGVFRKDVDVVFLQNTMIGTIAQAFINQDYYKVMNHLEDMPEAEFNQFLKNKLSNHIKLIFKALLTHES
ncbi:MAG: TetR/AcrR family transcriptional regulator, partial [Flavisolibacter sp.]|nr:TetR/AcrR family transcriptional regulator [Flavisolibacter sp.]